MSIRHTPPARRAGFTLVELSIVLVIVGLIAGGIMVGQTMIRQSELQSVLREASAMVAGANTFQARYGGLPGDIPNATLVWGKDNANCSGATGVVMTPGTCNGDGNGKITTGWNGVTDSWPEMFRFFQQMSLAGLLKGKYTGLTGPSSGANFVAGTNAPVSRWRNGTWGVWYANTTDAPVPSGSFLFNGNYGTFLLLGRGTTGHPWGSIMSPNEALVLDGKADDGRPGQGKIVSNNNTTSEGTGGCADGASADTANYQTTDATVTCILMFRQSL